MRSRAVSEHPSVSCSGWSGDFFELKEVLVHFNQLNDSSVELRV